MGETLGVRELRVRNFRCFASEVVELDPSVTVFVAENGAGKSAVLDALSIALATLVSAVVPARKQPRRGLALLPSDASALEVRPPYRDAAFPVQISAAGTLASAQVEWTIALDDPFGTPDLSGPPGFARALSSLSTTSGRELRDLPVIAHYGTSRSAEGLRQSKRPTVGRVNRSLGYRNGLDASANYAELTEWLAQTEWERTAGRGSDWEPVLLAVYSVATRMLSPHGVTGVRYSLEERDLIVEFGEPGRPGEPAAVHAVVPMALLADGYRATLALVADIAFRCGVLNHHLDAEAAELTEGVVLIDEIDMHLHPTWQARVVTDLVDAFPRVQFVLTTHSPLVVSSLDASHIRTIHYERGRSTIERFAGRTLGADVQYLTDAVFRGPTRADNDFSRAVAELGQALGRGDLEGAAPLAAELRDLLGTGSDFDAERLLREFKWRAQRRQPSTEATHETN